MQQIETLDRQKTDNLRVCSYCGYPSKKTIKCTIPKCSNKTCKGCTIFINDKPFCAECMIKMLNKDVEKIIFKEKENLKRLIR
jgi:hypothetical protein